MQDNRIVYTITIDKAETRISVSVVTVEFKPEGSRTQLIYTEQCAFFDGEDSVEDHIGRETDVLDKLGLELNDAQ
ncbi:hypothetical protein D3C81_1903670 [compost metagenome]